jgi:hypothetical protein
MDAPGVPSVPGVPGVPGVLGAFGVVATSAWFEGSEFPALVVIHELYCTSDRNCTSLGSERFVPIACIMLSSLLCLIADIVPRNAGVQGRMNNRRLYPGL